MEKLSLEHVSTDNSEDAGMEDSRRYPGDVLRSLSSSSANQWICTVDQTGFHRNEAPVRTVTAEWLHRTGRLPW